MILKMRLPSTLRQARGHFERQSRCFSRNQAASSTQPVNWYRFNPRSRSFTTVATVSLLIGGIAYSQLSPSSVVAESRSTTIQEVKSNFTIEKPLQDVPQVVLWGDNACKVTNPTSKEKLMKNPVRLPFFDNVYLRDLKLGTGFGAAIDANGDLIMWGKAHSDSEIPTVVLEGGDLASLAVSADRVIALSRGGDVYSLPVSQVEQGLQKGALPVFGKGRSWLSFWKRDQSVLPNINIRTVVPDTLASGEKIISISSGLYHLLVLTNHGRVFSSVSSSQDYPLKGQMGIEGLTWTTRPAGPIDQCMEISDLKGHFITEIATGDFHSLARDKGGEVFGFGDNCYGQLGVESTNPSKSTFDVPVPVNFDDHYQTAQRDASVTKIAAGGLNSFFVVESTPVPESDVGKARKYNHHMVDVWASGNGITGSLGTNRLTHVQTPPCRVPALSGLFEYSEKTRQYFPLPVSYLSVGSTHVAAVVDTTDVTDLLSPGGIFGRRSSNLPPTMADMMVFGGNEYWQLGTGKRANVPVPTFIPPIERKEGGEVLDSIRSERRMRLALRQRGKIGGKDVEVEQRVVAGRGMTAVFWAVAE